MSLKEDTEPSATMLLNDEGLIVHKVLLLKGINRESKKENIK